MVENEKKAPDTYQMAIENRCGVAKSFETNGMLEEAMKRYEALLKDETLFKENVNYKCAFNGLVETKKKQETEKCNDAKRILEKYSSWEEKIKCEDGNFLRIAEHLVKLGNTLKEEHDLEGAKKAYNYATKLNKDSDDAENGLQEITLTETKEKLGTLSEFGLKEEVNKMLPTILETDPMFGQKSGYLLHKTNQLGYLLTEIGRTRVDDFLNFFKGYIPSCLTFKLQVPSLIRQMSLFEAIIWLWAFYLLGLNYLWGTPTLDIGDFISNSENTEFCNFFAIEFEHQLMDLSNTSNINHKILMVTGPIDNTALPDFTKGLPVPTKLLEFVSTLLVKIFSRPSLTVTGSVKVQKEGQSQTTTPNKTGSPEQIDSIESVTIQIESGKRILAKHTLVANNFFLDNKDIDFLAVCATAWLIFMFQKHPITLLPKLKSYFEERVNTPKTILGTSNWEAYTWFALGDRWFQKDNFEKAKLAYLRSLSLDPLFMASRVNLAGVYQRQYDEEQAENNSKKNNLGLLESAQQQLQIVENKSKSLDLVDPTLYTWLFRQIIVSFELYRISNDSKYEAELNNLTARLVNQVCIPVNKQWSWLFRNRPKVLFKLFFNPNLKSYLEWRNPVAECMVLGIKSASNRNIDRNDDKTLKAVAVSLENRVDFYSLYNLTCTLALLAEKYRNEDYKNECFKFLAKSLAVPKAMKQFNPDGSSYHNALKRAKNDLCFNEDIQSDHRFKDLIITPLDEESKRKRALMAYKKYTKNNCQDTNTELRHC
ncbi:hypothetical protein EDE11_1357 [Methylomonas methanica]|nr:hypothetical protein EDE11_1357 [Methylomonas methanica]